MDDTDNLAFDYWDPSLPETVEGEAGSTVTYTAMYAEDSDNDNEPDKNQMVTIVFNAGEVGTFATGEATVSGEYLIGSTFPAAPQIKVDDTDNLAFDYWDPSLPETVEGEAGSTVTYTAMYAEDSDNDNEPDKNQMVTIVFNAGEVGTFATGEATVSGEYLIGSTSQRPPQIKVDDTDNLAFDYWDPSLPETVEGEAGSTVTYTAMYAEDSDNDNEPDKNQMVTIVFDAGEVGTFATGEATVSGEYLIGSEFPTAPQIKVDDTDNLAFDYWNPSLPETVEGEAGSTVTYTAMYAEDSDNDNEPDKNQMVTIVFDAGEAGTFATGEATVSGEYLIGSTFPTAPQIKVDDTDNLAFDYWDPSLPETVEGEAGSTVTYTAMYAEDSDNDNEPDKNQMVTIVFDAGEAGTFANGEATVSGEYLIGSEFPTAPQIKVDDTDNLAFDYWNPSLPETVEGEAGSTVTYTAMYAEDSDNDNEPDKNQMVTIVFDAGEAGTFATGEATVSGRIPDWKHIPDSPADQSGRYGQPGV